MRGSVESNGSFIRQLREHKCWTRAELASKADVSERTIENAENSKRLDRTSLTRIAKAFCVPVQKIKRESAQDAIVETLTNGPATIDVEIRLSVPFELLAGEAQIKQLIDVLLKAASINGNINVQSVRRGSTVITIEMSTDDAARLFAALCDARLDQTAVESLNYFPIPGTGQQFHDMLVAIKAAHDTNSQIDVLHIPGRDQEDIEAERELERRRQAIEYEQRLKDFLDSNPSPEEFRKFFSPNEDREFTVPAIDEGYPETIECINRRVAPHSNDGV